MFSKTTRIKTLAAAAIAGTACFGATEARAASVNLPVDWLTEAEPGSDLSSSVDLALDVTDGVATFTLTNNGPGRLRSVFFESGLADDLTAPTAADFGGRNELFDRGKPLGHPVMDWQGAAHQFHSIGDTRLASYASAIQTGLSTSFTFATTAGSAEELANLLETHGSRMAVVLQVYVDDIHARLGLSTGGSDPIAFDAPVDEPSEQTDPIVDDVASAPTPTTAGAGLMLLAGLAFSRRRRKA